MASRDPVGTALNIIADTVASALTAPF